MLRPSGGEKCGLVRGADLFRPANEGHDRAFAANRHAAAFECNQNVVEQGVDDLLVDRLASGQPKGRGQLLGKRDAHGLLQLTLGIVTIRKYERGLEHRPGKAVDVKLTAGEPAHVCGVTRIEQDKGIFRRLRFGVDRDGATVFVDAAVEPGLGGQVVDHLVLRLESDQITFPCLNVLHVSILPSVRIRTAKRVRW